MIPQSLDSLTQPSDDEEEDPGRLARKAPRVTRITYPSGWDDKILATGMD